MTILEILEENLNQQPKMYKMKQICVFLLFIYVTVVLGNPVQNDYDVRGKC